MKKAHLALAAFMVMFTVTVFNGCARQNMNDSMDNSMDTMSEEKMESGTMQENQMQNTDMKKSMDKTMK